MTSLITIDLVFYLVGALLMSVAIMNALDASNPKRWTTALFWLLFSIGFLFGDLLIWSLGKTVTYRIIGGIVMLLALIAGFNLLGSSTASKDLSAEKNAHA